MSDAGFAVSEAQVALGQARMEIASLKAEVERLRAEKERLEVQLAGCGVAALGWSKGPGLAVEGDYGWSASYGDVVTLSESRDRLRAVLAETPENVERLVRAFCGNALVPQEDIQERIHDGWRRVARHALTLQRAAAGMEPTRPPVIHRLVNGVAACGAGPLSWPEGDRWTGSVDTEGVTCPRCQAADRR